MEPGPLPHFARSARHSESKKSEPLRRQKSPSWGAWPLSSSSPFAQLPPTPQSVVHECVRRSLFESVAPQFHRVSANALSCGNPSNRQSLGQQQDDSAPARQALGRRPRADPLLELGAAAHA
jgi:hypothetical protein